MTPIANRPPELGRFFVERSLSLRYMGKSNSPLSIMEQDAYRRYIILLLNSVNSNYLYESLFRGQR